MLKNKTNPNYEVSQKMPIIRQGLERLKNLLNDFFP